MEKNVSKQIQTVAKVVVPKVAKVVSINTIAKAFEIEALKGCKDRTDVATKIVTLLKSNNVTKTKNGELTVDRVKKQLGNMLSAIKKGNQKRWSEFKLEETEKEIKLVKLN